MTPTELIDKIFKDPAIKYELTEFEGPAIDFNSALEVIKKPGTGKQTGKTVYYLKTLAPFHSEKEEVQIYVEDGKSNPEEIIRQLWVYKLIHYYGYDRSEIELEKPVTFGGDVGAKFADIVVYTNSTKTTPKIVFEIKKPKRKDGIEQLRSYLNAEGSPIGVWSNGSDKVILYRPYPQEFDALPEIPRKGQTPEDLQQARLTLAHLEKNFDFKKILLDLEELVLGSSGVNVFNEIFKIIFAKIWDEKQAIEVRRDQSLEFKWFKDPELTYERINHLFKQAAQEWQGVFDENDKIKLQKEHLNVCIAPLERKRFLGSNLRIIDDAFEYLLPTEAKKKKGQFFTPRFVIDMCVRMLNPKRNEYVMDPACGSAGFLVHAMEWAYPASTSDEMELRKSRYASRYLWGVDFEEQAAKTSRALMLIAGDGHTNIFGPDVDTLEPRTWYRTPSGKQLMERLKQFNLTKTPIPNDDLLNDDDKAWEYFEELKFDLILSNPPFAGEVKVKQQLVHYELAKPALKRAKDKQAKEERDVLFIERIIKMLKPGGRAAVVLPQGKFNNSSLAFIREWILRKARLLAVVGLHQNTFKPHTGTKTSVLFIQKYTEEELRNIENVQNEVRAACPEYATQIKELLAAHENDMEIPEEEIPENIMELMLEEFEESEPEVTEEETETDEQDSDEESNAAPELEDLLEEAEKKIADLKAELLRAKQQLDGLKDAQEALVETQKSEIAIISEQWEGTKKELREHLKPIEEEHKQRLKALKEEQKEKAKQSKALIKQLEKDIPQAEYEKNLLTNKGKLTLILQDDDLLQKLSDRFVDAEVAKQLDYPIFMAVSEEGGKNNSGEYEYLTDENGNILEDENGNPMIKQDLVNYNITKEELEAMDEQVSTGENGEALPMAAEPTVEYKVKGKPLAIAEAFVKFAKEQGFKFWG
ncbi:MAG TPA: N-6 DNA methylase [Bacteroidia bacterium]|nr:N-6 DNA methylase [Bacteroidia bacterium]HRS58534.1 N-6 DNA methylase [Bacteroidia bacterium]